ncbi:MAG: thiamine pyrophosphate-dependent enzyme [Pseudomonadota bacterium]
MAGSIAASEDGFADRLGRNKLPEPLSSVSLTDAAISPTELVGLFESQLASRALDLGARKLGVEKRGFYSIGSAGHEGNAALANILRPNDPAFLHYRSGAFLIERARKAGGETPLWNMALSFVASADDPISGGRHKVIGSKSLFVPPQTSTIASHLPKAVGAAFGVALARTHKKADAQASLDSVVVASFGDASANHSTAQGAFNTAAHTAYRGLPLPIIFLCEDNGIGISVKTPAGWIKTAFSNRPGLRYVYSDGRDVVDAVAAARTAQSIARQSRIPVFLHMRTVRLMGHAGSDLEASYRARPEIEREADQDPLLHTARRLIENSILSREEIRNLYGSIKHRVESILNAACDRPKLETAEAVMSTISPASEQAPSENPKTQTKNPADARARSEPPHMSRLISLTLADEMALNPNIIVFGEDVGKKGGVYGATTRLQKQFGPSRAFDTVLDEQSILGMAIGAAHIGYLPIPEIQFLAYVHNAEDQIRGEAATLSFFSGGQYANPMVVRVAGLAYQKGFGGHFHNDNSVAVFRDIPGVILACPSSGGEAVRLLRTCIRVAREQKRVVIFLEPIALYGTKDLHVEGDGLMAAVYEDVDGDAPFGAPGVIGDGADLAIITYGNGVSMAQKASTTLAKDNIAAKIIDIRWLSPLPIDAIIKQAAACNSVLIVDECRRTGSLSEEIIAGFADHQFAPNLARVTGEDSFIPLGPAADTVLVQEADIIRAARALIKDKRKAAE